MPPSGEGSLGPTILVTTPFLKRNTPPEPKNPPLVPVSELAKATSPRLSITGPERGFAKKSWKLPPPGAAPPSVAKGVSPPIEEKKIPVAPKDDWPIKASWPREFKDRLKNCPKVPPPGAG